MDSSAVASTLHLQITALYSDTLNCSWEGQRGIIATERHRIPRYDNAISSGHYTGGLLPYWL